jgi:hypothetical protein
MIVAEQPNKAGEAPVNRLTIYLADDHVYLFTTHMTRNKEIAIAAVVVVAIVAVGVWLVRRRRTRA